MVKPITTRQGKTAAIWFPIVLCALSFSLSGCRQDYSLAPPANSEQVTVTVKLPKELEAQTLLVMYRSATCRSTSRGASGQRVEQDARHSINVQLERQGGGDVYQAKLPVDGGGSCQWHLSNVMFGVTYSDPIRFGENVTFGGGGGVVVIFDHNNSPRGGADIKIIGDLKIRKDYYPWIKENYLDGYSKRVSLLGEGGIYLSYQALNTRYVYFEPVFHSEFLVSSQGVKIKGKGGRANFVYPDGSVESVARANPDFLKLQTLRTGRARDCFSVWQYKKCPDRRPQLLPEWFPSSEKPGFGHYVIVDEWGNELPLYDYHLVGVNGQLFQDKTDIKGRTKPLPESAHPLRDITFPEPRW